MKWFVSPYLMLELLASSVYYIKLMSMEPAAFATVASFVLWKVNQMTQLVAVSTFSLSHFFIKPVSCWRLYASTEKYFQSPGRAAVTSLCFPRPCYSSLLPCHLTQHCVLGTEIHSCPDHSTIALLTFL